MISICNFVISHCSQRKELKTTIFTPCDLPSALMTPIITKENRINYNNGALYSSISGETIEILSNQDLIFGTILAFSIAFLFSFLQGSAPSSFNLVLWRDEDREKKSTQLVDELNTSEDGRLFNGEEWREISRPENYAKYMTNNLDSTNNSKSKDDDHDTKSRVSKGEKENKLALIALLILFVPIFSVEFFFALSRQFICGDYVTNVDDAMWIIDSKKATAASTGSSPWATQLCSPHLQ